MLHFRQLSTYNQQLLLLLLFFKYLKAVALYTIIHELRS